MTYLRRDVDWERFDAELTEAQKSLAVRTRTIPAQFWIQTDDCTPPWKALSRAERIADCTWTEKVKRKQSEKMPNGDIPDGAFYYRNVNDVWCVVAPNTAKVNWGMLGAPWVDSVVAVLDYILENENPTPKQREKAKLLMRECQTVEEDSARIWAISWALAFNLAKVVKTIAPTEMRL